MSNVEEPDLHKLWDFNDIERLYVGQIITQDLMDKVREEVNYKIHSIFRLFGYPPPVETIRISNWSEHLHMDWSKDIYNNSDYILMKAGVLANDSISVKKSKLVAKIMIAEDASQAAPLKAELKKIEDAPKVRSISFPFA